MNDLVLVRGGGDIATAVAHRLFNCGYRVFITEIKYPTVIRRTVSFAQAVYTGQWIVEGVKAVWIEDKENILDYLNQNFIPVIVDPDMSLISILRPQIVIDCTLSKVNKGVIKELAPLVVALGPGFEAGVDSHSVIETHRGHDLGRIIYQGRALKDTKEPSPIMGYSNERIIRSPGQGIVNRALDIGSSVKKGDRVCYIDNIPVYAGISGILRGMISSGIRVSKDMKIGDIDPRDIEKYCYSISDKGRTISGSVLEVVCRHFNRKK